MKRKICIILIIIIIIIAILTGTFIILNKKKNHNEEKKVEEINWTEMYINNLKIQEDDIEIGLLNLNNDEIPELIVKNSKKLYKIFSINKESKTVETIVKNEEINTIQLIYDYNSKNYMYGFITKKEPKKTKIFNQDIKTITQLDNSTDEYAMNNITVLENLEECVNKKIKSTDTTENIQKIFEETKKSYKTTDDYLKEKNSNIEDIVETTRNEVIEEKNKNI